MARIVRLLGGDNVGDGVKVSIEWSNKFKRNLAAMTIEGGELQSYIDMQVLTTMHPYLPFDRGNLAASGYNHTKIGSGAVVWSTPYARYLYYGVLMVDPDTGSAWARKGVPKVIAAPKKQLKFRGGGKRGSFWCERWKNDNLTQFEKAVQKKVGELMR